ncbi:MAG: LiaF domain-containing protein, partial [Chloroflexota bacterium]
QGIMSWRYPWAWEVPVFDWNLSLNPRIPLALHIEKGRGELDLDFTKTHLTDFRLEMGDGSVSLRLPDNAGETAVHIQAGIGSIAIQVPSGVAARIQVFKGQGNLEVDLARFPIVEAGGTEYCSSDYETATNRAKIHLELGLSSVKVT